MTKLQEINSEELLREIKTRIEQPPFQEKEEAKITDLKIDNEKLTAQLNDGRELSIPLSWFAKWGVENVNADKLRNYEIKKGINVYFSEIDEVLGVEAFIYGFNTSCQ